MPIKKKKWQVFKTASDNSHHTIDGKAAYNHRFFHVLKFHEPGLAPTKDATGAFHIKESGEPAYEDRYLNTFGYYSERAAVQSENGWFHVFPNGKQVYSKRFSWCGNFQENLCAVKDLDAKFFHIDLHGKRIYPQSFFYVGDFRDGIAMIQNAKGQHTHIDIHGYSIHNRWFFDLDVYHKGFARAKDGKGWFHIDRQGCSCYQARYQNIEPFYNGIARVETNQGAILLIDEKGGITQKLRKPLHDPFHKASAELVSYWRFYTLQTALELNIFDYMPATFTNLQKKIGLPGSTLKRFIRALEEMELVSKTSHRQWKLTDIGIFFKTDHPHSLKTAANLWKNEHFESWKELAYSLKTGRCAFNRLYKTGWFDWLKKTPEKNRLYQDMLSIYAKRDYVNISQHLDLTKHRSIIDIGGGKGIILRYILEKNTHLTGFLFDLPNVLNEVVIPKSLASRMKCISGNFFDPWPPFFVESAVLSRVLHDWSDKEVVQILKKLHFTLTDYVHNRIYIIENILDETNHNAGLLDLNMLVMTKGRERTLNQFKNLLKKAGFVLKRVLSLNQVSSILVCAKTQEE